MKNLKMRGIAILAALAMLFAGGSALAMPVAVEGDVSLPAVGVDDGTQTQLSVEEFHLLGASADGGCYIYSDGKFYTVPAEDISDLLTQIQQASNNAALPAVDGMETLTRGARNDSVVDLQTALNALGYHKGTVDGDYGAGTESAVQQFEQDMGLGADGKADPLVQLLAVSMTAPAVTVYSQPDPQEVFAAIADRVTVDMQPIYESGLKVEYDDMTGVGFISDGNTLRWDVSGSADIDLCQLTARFGLLVRDQDDGTVSVDPAVKLGCLCVRRPVLSEVIVKSGASRGTSKVEKLSAELVGVNTQESGYALLNESMIAALAGAEEAGELKLRIIGRYGSYDVRADSDLLPSLSHIGQVARQLKPAE